jgi:hypothetical protein
MGLIIRIKYLLITVCFITCGSIVCAQGLAVRNAGLRYEVDAKRIGTNINSEDALPRSREFKRIDSTYYVGWMYEGIYKFNHAADYLGFKNAAVPLEHAVRLLERDYRKQLATRSSDLMQYFPAYQYQLDYTQIAYNLLTCYNNMEEHMKSFELLRRVVKWNFQRDYMLDVYNQLAWTVHRNRYYTSAKYPFLKNNIDENERLANAYLDTGLRRIVRNKSLNATIFQPGYEEYEKQAVYHYKSMLYSYALKIDSASYYYNQMRNGPIFPHNNYATFRVVCGDFREAEKEYEEAVTQDAGDKRLKEWAYYSSILDIYKSMPKQGAELTRDMIKANGSTPGFGWYNIALARCLHYDGQVRESDRYANKAAEFKELHIGTTLTQAHYDFSLQLIKLMNKQDVWERQKFEHRNWWYNPVVLTNMTGLLGEKYLQQFLIINQFAQNPERERVIYKLFATESTVSWDEVWHLIKDFSTGFFLNRFQKELQTDERQYIRKYFRFFVARLKMKQGDYKEARILLEQVLRDPDIDAEYEKLLIARTYQAQAECAKELEDTRAYNDYLYRMYQLYPQLVPSTGMQMQMNLQVSGGVDEALVKRLKDCNINWATVGAMAPAAYLDFSVAGGKKMVTYYVVDRTGTYIVPKQSFTYAKPEEAGVQLAYRLFNIGGAIPKAEKEEARNPA